MLTSNDVMVSKKLESYLSRRYMGGLVLFFLSNIPGGPALSEGESADFSSAKYGHRTFLQTHATRLLFLYMV